MIIPCFIKNFKSNLAFQNIQVFEVSSRNSLYFSIGMVRLSITTWKSKHPNWVNKSFFVWTSIPSVSVSTPITERFLSFSKLSSIEITLYKSFSFLSVWFSVTR